MVGFDQVQLDSETKTIHFAQPGVEINLNAIGKGYALDRVAEWLEGQGVNDYLWHGGRSSVLARGSNRAGEVPAVDVLESNDRERVQRGGWAVGLRHPTEPGRRLAEFYLRDAALATAGSGTQFFEHGGRRYGHLIDPRTGWPASGVLTATAMAPTAAEADAQATAFFIMGPAETEQFCQDHPEVKAVLVTPASSHRGKTESIEVHAFGMQPEDWTRWETDAPAGGNDEKHRSGNKK